MLDGRLCSEIVVPQVDEEKPGYEADDFQGLKTIHKILLPY